MGVFDNLAGAPTVQRLMSAPGGIDHGTFKPGRPFPPIWTADGDCRFGFTKFGNGYVRGPEGTSYDQFTTAVRAGQIPGVPVDAALVVQDYYDAMYIAATGGRTSLYDAYVRPEDGGGDGDPCASVKAELKAAQDAQARAEDAAKMAGDAVWRAKTAAAKARKAMPGKGGGVFKNILVELIGTLEGL